MLGSRKKKNINWKLHIKMKNKEKHVQQGKFCKK